MASFKSSADSSSSLPTRGLKYDVFLSFRGKDTRYKFVDHLYAALLQNGICVFKDDENLNRGKSISNELLKAIEESRSAVVVFSKNYVFSSWCLVELAKIMKWHNQMRQKVVPVFYHVDPSDLRGQKKDVAVAFQQHEDRFREEMDKVNEWREALTAAANLSGLHISDTFKEGESTYINKIVQEIIGDKQPCDMEHKLVGVDRHMDALISLLRIGENKDVRIVGIFGMGGLGKTSIAQALFRRIAYKFEGSSFVKDVRENSSSKKEVCALQEKVLREILLTNHKFDIQDPEDGANLIRTRFGNKNVLLILDDVDNGKQLEFLAATHHSLGPGSRIIITTRNENLLSDANAKYKPDFLQIDEALELFSRHAFRKNSPPEGYEELSCRAIRNAGYLPLAVKVLGSFFRGRKASVWESALNRLAKAPNIEIFETLKLSFDGLEASEKKIFLDIACFYRGKSVQYVTKVLDGCGFDPVIGISVLIEKSLITISNEGLDMHDLIQEMGWHIVRESFPNSRLWQCEDIHDFVKLNKKLKAIEAIVLHKQHDINEKVPFSANVFEGMKNLRVLDIYGKFTSCEPTFLPHELRWLRWSHYPFSSLQVAQMSKLVGLEVVEGTIQQFWNGQKIMPNLKFVKLQHLDSLTTFPDVSGAPNIERLILLSCKNLVEVHESLGTHKRLVKLYLTGCEGLKCLPLRIEMESLQVLKLTKCYSLERFPDISPSMVKLSCLYLDHCFRIEELPPSVTYLSGLRYLNLKRTCLKNIPNTVLKNLTFSNFKKQQKLLEEHRSKEYFKMRSLGFEDYSEALERLPKSISLRSLTNLCSLRTLDLSLRQMEDGDFPKNLHAFSSLEILYLSGNCKIIQLPASITQLSRLKCLKLNECCQLKILKGLPSRIQVLEANNCSSLEKTEELWKEYDYLCEYSFINCQKLLHEQNEGYLLQQSFLQRCVAAHRLLKMAIPGVKIPGWFKEEQRGCKIALMIPPKCNTRITGFVICGVFPGKWQEKHYNPIISTAFKKDGKSIRPKDDCIDASVAAENGNIWISYRPFSSFRGFQYEDWFGGTLVITLALKGGAKAVRCAACLIFEDNMEFT